MFLCNFSDFASPKGGRDILDPFVAVSLVVVAELSFAICRDFALLRNLY